MPCKSILRAITLASRGDHIYVDGTNTDRQPYNCTGQTGIYINKSLSLIGYGSPIPQIRCPEGAGLTFNGTDDAGQMSRVTLSKLFVNGSFVTFLDSSAKISGCTFKGSKLGVRFLIRQKLVFGVDITNSTFSASRQCVSVNIKDAKTTSEPIQVMFNITNSLFEGNVLLDEGACILFTKIPLGNRPVNCNKTFKNVTFVHNRFGSKGLVFVEMGYGSQNINFQNVTFTENSPSSGHALLTGEGHSECIVRSTTVNISINSSKFKSQSARVFNISAVSISLQIYNSNFCGHSVEGKGGVVFLRGTDCHVKVCGSSFVNTTAAQGGTFNIACTKLQSGSFLDSSFLNNTARSSGGAVYIHSLGSASNDTEHTTKAKSSFNSQSVSVSDQSPNISITKCNFKNAISFCEGGAVHINLPTALVTLRESNFTNCTNVHQCAAVGNTTEKRQGGGGAVYIMSALMAPANHLVLVLESSSFVRCSSPNVTGGALIVIYEKKLMTSINHTRFICNQGLYGGAIGILYLNRSQIGRGKERNYITIENSNFSNNSALERGGGIYLEANTRSTFTLEKVTMDSNHVGSSGGAVSVYFLFNLTIHKSEFSRNTAVDGGALDLSYVKKLVVQDSLFEGNYALQSEQFGDYGGGAILVSVERLGSCASENSKSDLIFKDARFEGNAGTTGGAVCLLNSNATFQNCSFINNFAVNQGAHVYTSIGYGSLIFQDSFLRQIELQPFEGTFSKASLLYADSPGALKLHNTSVDLPTYGALNPIMLVTNGRHIDGNDNLTRFFCPRGSQIEITNISTAVCYPGFEFQTTSSVQVKCAACTDNSYSLQRGSALGYHATPGFRCLPCPFEANCSKNVLAKPNFWGFKEKTTPPSLKFIMCPSGYCSQPPKPNASEYNTCQGNRSGKLCGACRKSYTETLYSTNCRVAHGCKDYWFWPVALLYVSIMALYFTFKRPIVPWIRHQITWFRKNEPAAGCDNDFDSGYLKIIFYFYQAANLVLVNKSSLTVVNTKFIQPLVGLFNFHQEFSPSGLICPFPGLTVVTKHLFIASHVFGTLLMVGIFYIFHWGVQKVRRQDAPSVDPYFGGVLQTMLLGYTTLASVAFNLVRCVSIGRKQRLFYDGNVVCYGWWQYVFIAFNCTFFVPFLLILLWGSFKLLKKTVSAGMFLLACCFPLPFLLYWAYISFIRGARNGAIGDTPSSQLSRNSVEKVLYDPFKRPENGTKLSLSWESVMIGRRLILVVLKTFVSDPMPRLLLMSFLCFSFLLHHALTQPFRDDIANAAETISLLLIGLLGMVNIYFASFLSLAVSPSNDHFSSWQNACQLVEIIILCAAPAIFALLVAVFALSQVVRLFFKICCILYHLYVACFSWCGRRKYHDMSPLLAPSWED